MTRANRAMPAERDRDHAESHQEVASSTIDKEKLRGLLIDAFKATSNAAGKSITLVIGNTGAGKSTTINYLLGCPMEEIDGPDGIPRVRVREGGRMNARIGHSLSISETLYPEIFESSDGIHYCDCAGFGDNRGPEYPICAAIATKIAVNSSRHVKSIIVVIEQDSLISGRGHGLRSVFCTLQEFFSNREGSAADMIDAKSLKGTIIFAITKVNPKIKTLKVVETIKNEQKSKSDQTPETSSIVFMCDLIISNASSIIHVDPLDSGESRNLIVAHILKATPLLPKRFGFPAEANTKKELRDLLGNISALGIKIIRDLVDKPNEIEEKLSIKAREEKTVREFSEKIISITERPAGEVDAAEFTNLEKLREESKVRAGEKRAEKKSAEEKLIALKAKLVELDSDEAVQYWEDTYDEMKIFGVVKVGVINTKTFTYNGIAFDRSQYACTGEGSKFSDEESSPLEGKYQVNYSTGPNYYGSATVRVLVQKRNLPNNKSQIELIKAELDGINNFIHQLQEDIQQADTHVVDLEKSIVRVHENNLRAVEENKKLLIDSYTREKSDAEARLNLLNEGIAAATAALEAAKKMLPSQVDSFELVKRIAPVIGEVASNLVGEFLALYAKNEGILTRLLREIRADRSLNTPSAVALFPPNGVILRAVGGAGAGNDELIARGRPLMP